MFPLSSFSAAVTDSYRFGRVSAGEVVSDCSFRAGESNELWRFDALSHWTALSPNESPPPREQHSAAVADGKMLVFGGLAANEGSEAVRPVYKDGAPSLSSRVFFCLLV